MRAVAPMRFADIQPTGSAALRAAAEILFADQFRAHDQSPSTEDNFRKSVIGHTDKTDKTTSVGFVGNVQGRFHVFFCLATQVSSAGFHTYEGPEGRPAVDGCGSTSRQWLLVTNTSIAAKTISRS